MQGAVLASWLRKLQAEFVARMAAIDAEVADERIDEEAIEEHISGETNGDVEMMDREDTLERVGEGRMFEGENDGAANNIGMPPEQERHDLIGDLTTNSQGTFSELSELREF